jgi:hypothetical protein
VDAFEEVGGIRLRLHGERRLQVEQERVHTMGDSALSTRVVTYLSQAERPT